MPKSYPGRGHTRPEIPIPNDVLRTDVTGQMQRMELQLENYRKMTAIAVSRLPEHKLEINVADLEEDLWEVTITTGDRSGAVIVEAVPLPVYPARPKRATRFRDGD